MNNNKSLKPITDSVIVQRLELMIEDLVDKPGDLNTDWICKMKWITVPVESASHFDENQAVMLSEALQNIGCKKCFAVAVEPLKNFPHCFNVNTTKGSLLEFSDKCSHFNFILLPEDKSFVILCTVYDYFVISGSLKFVKQAVGGNIDSARMQFKIFSSDKKWTNSERRRLLSIAKKYEINFTKNK
jgi:hypothetical protein